MLKLLFLAFTLSVLVATPILYKLFVWEKYYILQGNVNFSWFHLKGVDCSIIIALLNFMFMYFFFSIFHSFVIFFFIQSPTSIGVNAMQLNFHSLYHEIKSSASFLLEGKYWLILFGFLKLNFFSWIFSHSILFFSYNNKQIAVAFFFLSNG